MKKLKIFCLFVFIINSISFAKVAAVLDFDTEEPDLISRMPIMTDMFRAELANTESIDVVDRKHTQEVINELALQLTEITSNNDVKSIGEMLNADYIVIGHVQPLLNDPVTHVYVSTHEEPIEMGFFAGLFAKNKTKTVTDYNTYETQEKRINVVIQMIDVETAKVVSSGRLDLDKWSDFSKYCPLLVKRIMEKIGSGNILKSVEPDMFAGTWEGELSDHNIIDTYTFTFKDNNIVTATVNSIDRNGNVTISTGKGRYKYSKQDYVFVITINSLQGEVKHINKIIWKTMVKPDEDIFTVVVPVSSQSDSKKKAVDFYKVVE